jgi:hypothetical protein
MSPVKEPRFFAEDDPQLPFGDKRVASRDQYELLFESAAPLRGEASPSYSQYPRRRGVPERIHALIPEALFVYLVGDPVRRMVSHHMQRVAAEGERQPFAEALGDLDDPMNPYVCASSYATQLERYNRFFEPNRILVVDQADLRDRRLEALREIWSFLGVDPTFDSPAFEKRANVGYRRLPRPLAAVRRSRLIVGLQRKIPASMYPAMTRFTRRLARGQVERPVLDEALQARLREALKDEVERLRAMTGKDFDSWSV